MKGLVCLACLALLFLPTALAEDDAGKLIDALDLSGMESVSKDAGALFDLRQLLRDLASGQATLDPEAIAGMLCAAFLREWRESASLLPGTLVPALLSAVAACLAKRRSGTEAAGLVCYLACASACGARVLGLAKEASALVGHTVAVGNAVFPLLTALLSATGASGAASMLTPASALFASVCVSLLQSVGLRLGVAAAGIATAGNLNPRFRLKKLFSLICEALNWGAGLLMTFFVGLLSVQGKLSAGYDSASVRAARYTVDNLLPVIGGDVADTLDVMLSSAIRVKNAVGVAGMALVLARCFAPILRLTAALLMLRLSSAIMEPLGEERLSALALDMARVVQTFLVIASASAVLLLLLLGSALTAAQGVAG